MDRKVVVSLEALNNVLRYLVDRPYKEVADIIHGLKDTIREIPNEEKEIRKEESPEVTTKAYSSK